MATDQNFIKGADNHENTGNPVDNPKQEHQAKAAHGKNQEQREELRTFDKIPPNSTTRNPKAAIPEEGKKKRPKKLPTKFPLSLMGTKRLATPEDGHCMYHAISRQIAKIQERKDTTEQNPVTRYTVDQLRKLILTPQAHQMMMEWTNGGGLLQDEMNRLKRSAKKGIGKSQVPGNAWGEPTQALIIAKTLKYNIQIYYLMRTPGQNTPNINESVELMQEKMENGTETQNQAKDPTETIKIIYV
jgi:hypothetical protein